MIPLLGNGFKSVKRILILLVLIQSVLCGAIGQVPGHRIVFVSDRHHPGTGGDIYSMDVDGSNVVRLTVSNAVKCTPTWSPDGRRILFSDARNGNEDIYRINADGTNEVRLTSTPGRDQRGAGKVANADANPRPRMAGNRRCGNGI